MLPSRHSSESKDERRLPRTLIKEQAEITSTLIKEQAEITSHHQRTSGDDLDSSPNSHIKAKQLRFTNKKNARAQSLKVMLSSRHSSESKDKRILPRHPSKNKQRLPRHSSKEEWRLPHTIKQQAEMTSTLIP